MKVTEFLLVSLEALRANKARSLLTMLGIIIGVAAVITMISLGQGAKKAVEEQMTAMGTNLIYIRSGAAMSGHVRMAEGAVQQLDEKDLKRLRGSCATVDIVIPELTEPEQVKYGNLNWNTTIIGTSPEYLMLRNYHLADGENFTTSDLNALRRVAILGPRVVENLFPGMNPVGKTIRIGRLRFDVIGVTEEKGFSSGWMDYDDVVVIPYTTAQKRVFGVTYLERIIARMKDESMLSNAFLEIEGVLRRSHRLRPDQENDFNLRYQADYSAAKEETTQTLSYLLSGVALVSLIVGGIGIMNIMLVSVTERTREIGLRMAVGAKRRDILSQFVLESVTLALIGGLLGILLGIGSSSWLSESFGWSTLIAPGGVALSFFFAFAVGVSFGIYPARKASLLDPIEALRYE
jgi:putative ABC transport system permease protein